MRSTEVGCALIQCWHPLQKEKRHSERRHPRGDVPSDDLAETEVLQLQVREGQGLTGTHKKPGKGKEGFAYRFQREDGHLPTP